MVGTCENTFSQPATPRHSGMRFKDPRAANLCAANGCLRDEGSYRRDKAAGALWLRCLAKCMRLGFYIAQDAPVCLLPNGARQLSTAQSAICPAL
jgi:hypothetical protein